MKPMAKNTKHKKAESVAETLCSFSGFLCDIVISVYMIVILMVLPLYNKGYARIGTEKETFFLKTMTYGAKTLLPVFLLWLLFRLVTAVQKKELPKFTEWPAGLWKNLSVTDRFAVFYGIAVLVSYLFTNYREEALWGTASWRMGMWTQLGAVIVYFMISRMWQWKNWIPALVLPVSAVVFSLGYVNKFGLLPVDPEYVNPSFISTIGNINWYCGYLVTVLFGGVYLLWRMEPEMTRKKLLLMAYVTIGFASLATQGSSSGMVTFAVIMFVLFGMSVKDSGRMEVFWQEMTMFSGACLLTFILRKANVFSQELVLEGMTDLLTFSMVTILMTILSGTILCLIHRARLKRSYPEKLLHRIYCGIAIAVPVMILLVLLLTLINTVTGGALTPGITDPEVTKWLTFNVSWGSARGGTWAAGARCFWEADFQHKIFGVGPDCLYAFLSNEGSVGLQTMVHDRFGGNRLTNAHNEWLTVLVDIGVLGLVSYAGMMITAIRDFLRAGESKMLVGACGICVLAYTVNNMFSFQQVMNISTVFVVMGIGENVWRSASD
jgi:O-antigen ligase